jgi:phosphoribosyl-AMP cyclohydrolase
MTDVEISFEDGLVPVVTQDDETDEVLTLAYASPEALRRTEETGLAHYHSRSRDELWQKGEESGHVQRVREIRVDCDADTLLYLVEQETAACHTGYHSCFHRRVDGLTEGGTAETTTVGSRAFDPDAVYDD